MFNPVILWMPNYFTISKSALNGPLISFYKFAKIIIVFNLLRLRSRIYIRYFYKYNGENVVFYFGLIEWCILYECGSVNSVTPRKVLISAYI